MRALTATLAALALLGGQALAVPPERPGKPDKPDKPDRSSFGKARSPLVRPHGAADGDAKGRIDVQRRRNGSDLRVMGQRLDPGLAVDMTIERLGDDPSTLDVVESDFVLASAALLEGQATNDRGAVKVMFRTHKDDALPLDATSLDDLAGARIRVRATAAESDAADLLAGIVPLIGEDLPARVDERVELDRVPEDGSCSGRLRMRFRGKDVRSELRIDVQGLAENDVVSFRMEDAEGSVVEIGSATADADGEARYRARTLQGDTLPFGAMTVLDLAGRAVEVWVNPEFVDETPEIADDPLVETGLCLTGAVPAAE